MPPGVTPTSMQVSPEGVVQFRDGSGPITPLEASWTFGFDRERKARPKALGRLALSPDRIVFDTLDVLTRFDTLVAVDTNSKVIRGTRVAVGTVVRCSLDASTRPRVSGSFYCDACLEFRDFTDNAEAIMWQLVLAGIAKALSSASASVGVFVDSELDLLPRMNSREVPIRGNFFVPEGCELLYASSDSGTEFLGHHLIRTCDRVARATLDRIEQEPALDQDLTTAGGVFGHYREWDIAHSMTSQGVSIVTSPKPL